MKKLRVGLVLIGMLLPSILSAPIALADVQNVDNVDSELIDTYIQEGWKDNLPSSEINNETFGNYGYEESIL